MKINIYEFMWCFSIIICDLLHCLDEDTGYKWHENICSRYVCWAFKHKKYFI